ncbi:alpha-defensin 3-like [Arvicola amphibius]|uniref:alpha-defensin 3-like n=1 Tax=Arvicola amphibius TaxID=1047088 RepID=UPI0018E30210|nr:alpha-defensin 3-like [Arvicola amphibius]
MKTLLLLSVLALLAFLAQADPLPAAAEETKNEEQPGAEDQDVTISFGDPEGSALQDAASRKFPTCYCRRRHCRLLERVRGLCTNGRLLCCR